MPKKISGQVEAVLFDLDGTLLDTADDLGGALNAILIQDDHQPLAMDKIRPHVSQGGMALIELGYGCDKNTPQAQSLWSRLLKHYSDHLAEHTRYFPGMLQVLDQLDQAEIAWGVVTNKPRALTEPLADQIGLSARTQCIVSGDTIAQKKPSPEPLYYACDLLGVNAENSIYVGDHLRDIQAGNHANMLTLIAEYGYMDKDEDLYGWGADGIINTPLDILSWLEPNLTIAKVDSD
jgi:2-phosphoglycolate phosphatase